MGEVSISYKLNDQPSPHDSSVALILTLLATAAPVLRLCCSALRFLVLILLRTRKHIAYVYDWIFS